MQRQRSIMIDQHLLTLTQAGAGAEAIILTSVDGKVKECSLVCLVGYLFTPSVELD
ncbi:hypothetical protein [Bradyrhizobium cenepequi]|uniref:hypothetical protein n=1 Tax=Bradyrhizobium cenepequi TaxID=2821403 RepID=UPI001CE2F8F2|nr:hypothetical protein [Bradyrhizobium cenepequi]MCA6108448.1 hypothetical protein [Bradyrhizobium cenepequi]